jgi:hypothetical protein
MHPRRWPAQCARNALIAVGPRSLTSGISARRLRGPPRGLGDLAVRVTSSAGRTPFVTSHLHSPSRSAANSSRPLPRPGQGGNGASCHFRMAAPAAAHAAGEAVDGSPRRPSAVPGAAAIASTGGFVPQDLRGRDRRQGHRLDLDVDARLIGVHLQEHIADGQGRALGMGDDNFDLIHGRPNIPGMTVCVTGFIACDCAADRVPLPGGLVHDTDR